MTSPPGFFGRRARGLPGPGAARQAAGILQLLDTQGGFHQGAGRRSRPSARSLRCLAHAGRAGEVPQCLRVAHDELFAGSRIRGGRRRRKQAVVTSSTLTMPAGTYQSAWLDDEVRMFRNSVRQFVQKEFVPHQDRWREQHYPDAEAWTAAGAAGILLPDVPEEYGGGG